MKGGRNQIIMEITRKDILLLLLYVQGMSREYNEPIRGITKLTKLLFLLKKIHHIDKYVKKFYSFEAHKLGPFTREIYDDIDFFDSIGFIEKKTRGSIQESEFCVVEEFYEDFLPEIDIESITQDTYRDVEFSLTLRGQEFTKKLYNQVPIAVKDACEEIKKKFGFLPLTELLRYIYLKFPDTATKTIRKDLLK